MRPQSGPVQGSMLKVQCSFPQPEAQNAKPGTDSADVATLNQEFEREYMI